MKMVRVTAGRKRRAKGTSSTEIVSSTSEDSMLNQREQALKGTSNTKYFRTQLNSNSK